MQPFKQPIFKAIKFHILKCILIYKNKNKYRNEDLKNVVDELKEIDEGLKLLLG